MLVIRAMALEQRMDGIDTRLEELDQKWKHYEKELMKYSRFDKKSGTLGGINFKSHFRMKGKPRMHPWYGESSARSPNFRHRFPALIWWYSWKC